MCGHAFPPAHGAGTAMRRRTAVISGFHPVPQGSNRISGKIIGTSGFFSCSAIISGTSVPFKYKNTGSLFSVNPGHTVTFKVQRTNGLCLGLIRSADSAYFTATYKVSTPANLNIKRS